MSEPTSRVQSSVKAAVVEALSARGKKAYFVTELTATLKRVGIGKDELESALGALQRENALVLRDNFCADPHLAEVDLRVAALVEGRENPDGYAAALREIDSAWNKWLGEFLANHRCG